VTPAWTVIVILMVLIIAMFVVRSPKARIAGVIIAFLLGASPMAGGFQSWVNQWWDAKPPTSQASSK
jgi:hypothetical protein